MRVTLLFTFLFGCVLHSAGQGWFSPEDKWIYQFFDGLSGSEGYREMQVEGDTLINGIESHRLSIASTVYSQMQQDTLFGEWEVYAYEENDQVFFYSGYDFKLVYDMNLAIGDTLFAGFGFATDTNTPLILESLSMVELGGQSLQKQVFRLEEDAQNFFGIPTVEVIEGVGNTSNFSFSMMGLLLLFDLPGERFCSFSRGDFMLGADEATCTVLPEPKVEDFAPIGARWYIEEFASPDYEGTVMYESLRDTVVNGRDCRIINKSHWTTSVPIQGEFIIHQEFGKIYHYIEEIDSFNLMFDLLAKPGDSWRSFDRGNSYAEYGFRFDYLTEVDSLSFLFVDNNPVPLQVQHITTYVMQDGEVGFTFQDQVMEKVGFRNAFIPDSGGDGVTDDTWEGRVRCYTDDQRSYNFTDGACLVTSTEDLALSELRIWPNPAGQTLYLDYPEAGMDAELSISSLAGQLLIRQPLRPALDLSGLLPGCYVVRIHGSAQHSRSFRLIKTE